MNQYNKKETEVFTKTNREERMGKKEIVEGD